MPSDRKCCGSGQEPVTGRPAELGPPEASCVHSANAHRPLSCGDARGQQERQPQTWGPGRRGPDYTGRRSKCCAGGRVRWALRGCQTTKGSLCPGESEKAPLGADPLQRQWGGRPSRQGSCRAKAQSQASTPEGREEPRAGAGCSWQSPQGAAAGEQQGFGKDWPLCPQLPSRQQARQGPRGEDLGVIGAEPGEGTPRVWPSRQ